MQHEGKPDDLSGRLRRLCELRGWRQTDLAEFIGSNLDRVKSLTTGKARKLYAGEIEALVNKHQVRREYLLAGEPPEFKTDAELAMERQLQLLGQSSDLVRRLDAPEWVKRTAQEWVFAVQRGDSQRVQELAQQSLPAAGEPRPAYLKALDEKRLEAVIEALLQELDRRHVHLPPAKVATLILTLLETTPAGEPVSHAAVSRMVRLAS